MRRTLGSISLLLLTFSLGTATAQTQPAPHDIAVVFDSQGTMLCDFPPPFTTNEESWVVGYYLDGGVLGYEFGLTFDPRLIIFSSITNPPTAINVGHAPDNWIVGTGVCLEGPNVLQLASLTYGVFTQDALDMLICLTPSTPSSFSPATPGYLRCDDALIPMGPYPSGGVSQPDGCGIVNPFIPLGKKLYCGPAVATESTSWGAVKARF